MLTSSDVSRHLIQPDGAQLMRWLEATSPFPSEASEPWPGGSLDELQARQSLVANESSAYSGVDLAARYWLYPYADVRNSRDRRLRVYAYQVLFRTAPESALSLALKLHDADFLSGLVGRRGRVREQLDEQQFLASQRSESSFLRALVALIRDPRSTRELTLISVADEARIDEELRLRLVTVAAAEARDAATEDVARKIFHLFAITGSSAEQARLIARHAWQIASRLASPLVATLEKTSESSAHVLSKALVAEYGLNLKVEGDIHFSGWQLEFLEVAVRALVVLHSFEPAVPLRELVLAPERMKAIRDRLRPLTPFRARAGADQARRAIALATLWEGCATLALGRSRAPEEAEELLGRIREVLEWPPLEHAEVLWSALARLETGLLGPGVDGGDQLGGEESPA